MLGIGFWAMSNGSVNKWLNGLVYPLLRVNLTKLGYLD